MICKKGNKITRHKKDGGGGGGVVRSHVRARSSAVNTFLYSTRPLKARTTMPFATQSVLF